jgi:hypothetical protein
MKKWIPLVVLPIVIAGCASLKPEQSARLTEAQRFVDEVTVAYSAPHLRVIVDNPERVEYYGDRYDWTFIRQSAIDVGNVRLALVEPPATIGPYWFVRYWPMNGWITIPPFALDGRNVRLALVKPLALATLQPPGRDGSFNLAELAKGNEASRRGVEIMVKFLGMSTRQAVDYYATYFIAVSKQRRSVDPDYDGLPVPPPCVRLRTLWTHFAIADQVPACGA